MLSVWKVGVCARQGLRAGDTEHRILDGEWHEKNSDASGRVTAELRPELRGALPACIKIQKSINDT